MKKMLKSICVVVLIIIYPGISFAADEGLGPALFPGPNDLEEFGREERGSFIKYRSKERVPNSLAENVSKFEYSQIAFIVLYQRLVAGDYLSLLDLEDEQFESLKELLRSYYASVLEVEHEKDRLICPYFLSAERNGFAGVSESEILAESERIEKEVAFTEANRLVLDEFLWEVERLLGGEVSRELDSYVETFGKNYFYVEPSSEGGSFFMGARKIDLIRAKCH